MKYNILMIMIVILMNGTAYGSQKSYTYNGQSYKNYYNGDNGSGKFQDWVRRFVDKDSQTRPFQDVFQNYFPKMKDKAISDEEKIALSASFLGGANGSDSYNDIDCKKQIERHFFEDHPKVSKLKQKHPKKIRHQTSKRKIKNNNQKCFPTMCQSLAKNRFVWYGAGGIGMIVAGYFAMKSYTYWHAKSLRKRKQARWSAYVSFLLFFASGSAIGWKYYAQK